MPPKRAGPARKSRKNVVPVSGGWDELPHGMGMRRDLDTSTTEADTDAEPPAKRAKLEPVIAQEELSAMINNLDKAKENTNHAANESDDQAGEQDELMTETLDSKDNAEVEVKSKARRGRAKKVAPTKPESLNERSNVDSAVTDNLTDPAPKRSLRARSTNIKTEDTDAKDEEVLEETPKKTRAPRKKAVKSEDVEIQDEEMKDADVKEDKPKKTRAPCKKAVKTEDGNEKDESFEEKPKVPRKKKVVADGSEPAPKKEKKKANPYGLTPGLSPFPEHAAPTPEAAEEVYRILSELHGESKQPAAVPKAQWDRAGCGDVPDLLDALLRTVLSANTSMGNAKKALEGLKVYGERAQGAGKGSINWEGVHEKDVAALEVAIQHGGLHKMKSKVIKEILAGVYQENFQRRDALLEEKKMGKPADIIEGAQKTQEQKDFELARYEVNMLTLDHIFDMSNDEAMIEMTKLKGIGVKTAACVILFCMNRPCFAVDTHVHRFCRWLGWVPEKANEIKTFSHGEVRIPDHLKYGLHQLFIRHGQTCYRCQANTGPGGVEWDDCVCPLEHLAKRTGVRKNKVIPPKVPKEKIKKGKKAKKDEEESDEEEVVAEEISEHEDEVDEGNEEIGDEDSEELADEGNEEIADEDNDDDEDEDEE